MTFAQSVCLENIKEGRFTHFASDGETIIIRKKNSQTEYFDRGKIKSKVTWIKEDEYLLEITKIKKAELVAVNVGSIISVKVIGCHENYYDFTISLNNNGEIIQADARYYW
ncbi:hypothetical protein G5B10_14785 [Fluviicola sp. SGL-29]|uniref:hypothetical protein n=1 Tax=Taishania pollutisoli TaxID=2766479 RepID=UPI0013CD855C|nr:hypothetical protein [Taishania pollutisoli]NGF77153.1 hypothetical protein [Fluviicola sp. SGL-29]